MADTIVSRMQDAVVLERPMIDEAVSLLRAIAVGRPVTPAEAKAAVLRIVAGTARSDEELRMFPEHAEAVSPGRSVVSIHQAGHAAGRGIAGGEG